MEFEWYRRENEHSEWVFPNFGWKNRQKKVKIWTMKGQSICRNMYAEFFVNEKNSVWISFRKITPEILYQLTGFYCVVNVCFGQMKYDWENMYLIKVEKSFQKCFVLFYSWKKSLFFFENWNKKH